MRVPSEQARQRAAIAVWLGLMGVAVAFKLPWLGLPVLVIGALGLGELQRLLTKR